MPKATKVAAILGLLVFLQVSCAVSRHETLGNVIVKAPAVMTVNGFQQGGSGGGPASCNGQYHSDSEFIVSLSSEWYTGGQRCGNMIRLKLKDSGIFGGITTIVVDECDGCDGEVGASPAIWHNFRLDPSLGEVKIT